ncbi:unnamed protein product [Penicillium bialowiezense]
MEWIGRTWTYLTTLEWTERVQHNCRFCDRSNFASIAYEDDHLIAVENIRPAGLFHWLILPKEHVARDIESLDGDHLSLCKTREITDTG